MNTERPGLYCENDNSRRKLIHAAASRDYHIGGGWRITRGSKTSFSRLNSGDGIADGI